MIPDAHPAPIPRSLRTRGVGLLLILMLAAVLVAAWRFTFGLSAVTNLDQQHPWGLWIALDVATGVALAAGGFTTAALAHVFHRWEYEAVTRPALLTAALGYTFVGIGLLADLGRPYNIWHPMIYWQGNSVLFEVGMCVMIYLTVLYIEFLPIVCQRLESVHRYPRLSRWARRLNRGLSPVMFVFIIAGVVLSCLHQSSLGNLMVIAPTKVHPLWYSPILSLLFLLSAIAVGFPMVVVESMWASWSLKLKPEMHVLGGLARYMPLTIGIYLAFKVGDLAIRESYPHLADLTPQTFSFLAEVVLGLAVPLVMLLFEAVRRSPRLLLTASLLVVLGVALNRINVFLVAYQPPYATKTYFPAIGEFVLTAGLIASLALLYRLAVTFLPVVSVEKEGQIA